MKQEKQIQQKDNEPEIEYECVLVTSVIIGKPYEE